MKLEMHTDWSAYSLVMVCKPKLQPIMACRTGHSENKEPYYSECNPHNHAIVNTSSRTDTHPSLASQFTPFASVPVPSNYSEVIPRLQREVVPAVGTYYNVQDQSAITCTTENPSANPNKAPEEEMALANRLLDETSQAASSFDAHTEMLITDKELGEAVCEREKNQKEIAGGGESESKKEALYTKIIGERRDIAMPYTLVRLDTKVATRSTAPESHAQMPGPTPAYNPPTTLALSVSSLSESSFLSAWECAENPPDTNIPSADKDNDNAHHCLTSTVENLQEREESQAKISETPTELQTECRDKTATTMC